MSTLCILEWGTGHRSKYLLIAIIKFRTHTFPNRLLSGLNVDFFDLVVTSIIRNCRDKHLKNAPQFGNLA